MVKRGGKMIRLAFRKGSNVVIETKNMGTGDTSYPQAKKKKRKATRKRRY